MSGLLIFLLLLNAYIVALFLIHRSGRFQGTLDLMGPFLMWKTQKGKRTIDRLANAAPKAWGRWADVGIWATWAMGLLVLALLVFQLYVILTRPQQVAENAPAPSLLIGLPGVNPMIPLGYGLAGLLIALVIHEGSHGVLARVGRMGVKSLGLLFFIVPIGAFVEPDEKDVERASTRAKNRVFAAGPMSNLCLAVVAGVIFSSVFMGSVAVANDGEGVGVADILADTPAAERDFRSGDIIVAIDGQPVTNGTVFSNILNTTSAGDTITVQYIRDEETLVTPVTLMDRKEYYEREYPDQADEIPDWYAGKGFLGVVQFDFVFVGNLADVLADPFRDGPIRSLNPSAGGSFIIYSSYPFLVFSLGLDVLAEPYRDFLVVQGPMAAVSEDAFYLGANLFYWIFWLNLMLGTFNALPAGPLDGGQMFKATLRDRLYRWYGVDEKRVKIEQEPGVPGAQIKGADEETQAKLERVQHALRRATWTLGLFILGLILLPIVAPPVINLLFA